MTNVRIKIIENQELLCKRCYESDTLLCSGLRNFVDDRGIISSGYCERVSDRFYKLLTDKNLLHTGLTEKMIKTVENTESIEFENYCLADRSMALFLGTIKFLVDCLDAGLKVFYGNLDVLFENNSGDFFKNVSQIRHADYVFIDKINCLKGYDANRITVYEAIVDRKYAGNNTLVTKSSAIVPRNEEEKSLLEEIWNTQ